MSKWKPRPWGMDDMAITLGPALLVVVGVSVRWLIAGWSTARIDALGLVEILVVSSVIGLSVLGVVDTVRVNGGRVGWAWSVGNGGYVKMLNWYGLYGVALLYAGWAGALASPAGYLLWGSIGLMVLGGWLTLIVVIVMVIAWVQDSRPTSAAPLYEPRNKSRACRRP